MPKPRALPNCPITEALIDIRVTPDAAFKVEVLDQQGLPDRLGYVRRGPILVHEVRVELDAASSKTFAPPSTRIGTRFHSADERFVLQLTVEGFTLSRLRPYEAWESLRDEARRLWPVFADVRLPEAITRVATRFINNLSIPLQDAIRLEDYLRGSPPIPPELPQEMAGFFQRVVVIDRDTGARTIVTQALKDPPVEGRIPLILDIDCQLERRFDPDGTAAFEHLDRLRALKNRFFFELLTEKSLELYR